MKYNPNTNLIIDAKVYSNESWFSVFLGILFILSGCKEFTRWTLWTPPLPYFGLETTITSSALISMVWGLAFIFIGHFILKLRKMALYLTLVSTIAYIISIILGWSQWDKAIEVLIKQRSEYLGRVVRPIEIELMQAITPEVYILIAILGLFAVFLIKKRLKY